MDNHFTIDWRAALREWCEANAEKYMFLYDPEEEGNTNDSSD